MLRLLLWLPASVMNTGRMVMWAGRAVSRMGIGRIRQIIELGHAALVNNIPPPEWYGLGMFNATRRWSSGNYFLPPEWMMLGGLLQPITDDLYCINRKDRFFHHCVLHDLPAVETIVALGEAGDDDWWFASSRTLPPCDLFTKPNSSSGGEGARKWVCDAGSARWCNGDDRLNERELLASLRRRSCVVQRVETNDASLMDIAPSGLATIRVVTLAWPDGELEILCAGLRLPVGEMIVDNFAAGGILAPVALDTGRLGVAVAKEVRRGSWSTHPETEGRIEGREIAQWKDVVDLVIRAHRSLPTLRSIGWDVAITPRGPVLVEANPAWCVILAQRVLRMGLGETRFVDWFWRWRAHDRP